MKPSSLIREASYNEATATLTVTFQKGGVWSYAPVPPLVATELEMAESPGRYYLANIKPIYTGAPQPQGAE